jgi:hypothetical protein
MPQRRIRFGKRLVDLNRAGRLGSRGRQRFACPGSNVIRGQHLTISKTGVRQSESGIFLGCRPELFHRLTNVFRVPLVPIETTLAAPLAVT